jgi:hypothetical protein
LVRETDFINQYLATVVADTLEQLLRLLDESRVIHRHGQLDVTKMALTILNGMFARLAFEIAIDRSHTLVTKTANTWSKTILILRKLASNSKQGLSRYKP